MTPSSPEDVQRSDQEAPLDPVLEADEVLQRLCPALWAALSPLGRRVRQGAGFLPLQSAEARGKELNATIGQITDGRGRAVPLPSMEAALGGLDADARSQAFLYSPVEGLAPLRRLWRDRQRRGQPDDLPSTLPIVTMGPAQALALAAELFAAEGRTAVIPDPVRTEDRELFELRLGARLLAAPVLPGGRFDPMAVSRLLDGLPDGEPALAVLRFPGPAGGYAPAAEEREALGEALVQSAACRPLIAVADDIWEAPGEGSGSLFWSLVGRHPSLVPVKVDGADGALGFPGGRVGFLTLPFEPESAVARAIESKVKMLLRAAVGSPPAASQTVLLRGLAARPEGV